MKKLVKKEEEVGSVSVYNKKGDFLRVYSKEAHGADYKKLAKGFAEKVGGTVK